jgi:FkbM family methyltransferase
MISEKTFFSQFGEDRLLKALFENQQGLTCVEVGANDGINGSVSLHFEKLGWRCVLVEPNPTLCSILREKRNSYVFEGAASRSVGKATLMLAEGDDLSHAVSSIEPSNEAAIKRAGYAVRRVEVETAPLDMILEDAKVKSASIAFVSIDVEGHELEVLKGFSLEKWQPNILLIEDNSILFGSEVRRYLEERGYTRFRRTGVNDWYASEQFLPAASKNPKAKYWASMIRARIMMARRLAFARLRTIPILGPMLAKPLLALRVNTRA